MKRPSIKLENVQPTSIIYAIALVLIFLVALYIRVALPYESVFTDAFVAFGGTDPWYHMRLVDTTLHNFPHFIYFDAFTYYPHGTTMTYAPLFDYLLAVIIWIIGRGNPMTIVGPQGIDAIGAWYPAVLGALTVFPVYFIGKAVWHRNAGLLAAALIAILPGQFLSRSILGSTDQHVAETLFASTALFFFILALKAAKNSKITFDTVVKHDYSSLKKTLIYSSLFGLFLGIFYLMWNGAPLIIFILVIFAIAQFTIDYLRGENTDYLCITAIPAFIIALIMIAPIPYIGSITSIQAISLLFCIAVYLTFGVLAFVLGRKAIKPYGFPVAIGVVSALSLVLLNALNLPVYSQIIGALHVFVPSTSSLTIAEVHPMHIISPYTGRMADSEAWRWFSTTFFIAFAAFILLGYRIARNFRPEEVLILVWGIAMLFASFGQNRFAAWYAVNVALLCGYLSWEIIEFVSARGEKKGIAQKGKVKGKMKVAGEKAEKAKTKSNAKQQVEKATWHLPAELIFTVLIIGLVVFYPPLNTALATARYGGGPDYDWYESLAWMNANTPEPGLDYYELYALPPFNKSTNSYEEYPYPESAYSVISWWDYGHYIMRIARRIPVANPFQQGIGGPYAGNAPGACVFFTAKNETAANEVADALDVKYVVSDFMMADAFNAFYNKFGAMTVWANDTAGYYTQVQTEQGVQVMPSAKYYTTIVARLHIFDGTGIALSEDFYLEPLRHYRLSHESPSTIITLGGRAIKYIKVFEYVPGATVQGNAPFGTLVEITTNVTTNQGRTFEYSEQQICTGSYEFIVPYSTEGPIDGGTNFDVTVSPYTLRVGYYANETIMWAMGPEVRVTEEDVLGGRTITANLI